MFVFLIILEHIYSKYLPEFALKLEFMGLLGNWQVIILVQVSNILRYIAIRVFELTIYCNTVFGVLLQHYEIRM